MTPELVNVEVVNSAPGASPVMLNLSAWAR